MSCASSQKVKYSINNICCFLTSLNPSRRTTQVAFFEGLYHWKELE